MFYNANVTANANGYNSEMTINDTINTDKVFIGGITADDATKAYVLDPSGAKVAGATIKIDRSIAGKVTVSGSVTGISDAFATGNFTLVVPTYVLPTKVDYTIADDSSVDYTPSHTGTVAGNSRVTYKVTPAPDKVWVLDAKGALTAADPTQTNQAGSDNKVFLPGDAVSAVVNGRVPAKLASNLSNYQVVDDWTKASKYVDFTDATKAAVYAETTPGSGSYANVTNQFTVTNTGTVTTATANAAFLATTGGLAVDRKIKLVLSGAFRTDYSTQGQTAVLYNDGSEVWNNETVATNEPAVYTWTPNPNKQVLGANDESGNKAGADINGLSVWPGQHVQYSVGVDLRIPTGLARGISTLAVEDDYDKNFTLDPTSIQFSDSRGGSNPRVVPRSAYKITLDPASNKFTATFTPAWIAANVGPDSQWLTQGWLTLLYTGVVKSATPAGTTISNQAFQILNNSRTPTTIPTVTVPVVAPVKQDLNTNLDSIDGKTVVKGDIIVYRLGLDASVTSAQLAYNVAKLGMTDDYDEKYLSLDATGVRVTDQATGVDVTAKFNVQVKNGSAYIFAKTVNTLDPYGNTIAGDPQPSDLAAYDQATIHPLTDANIDQSLMGHKYWITMQTTVLQETDGYVIKNQAIQNTQNVHQVTNIVSNPLKAINPTKDVVVSEQTGANSINASEVKLNSTFNYRLNSSEIPANRAYGASQWSLSDNFDAVHDQYTGVWAIYANDDLYNGSTLIFKKGALLADSAGHQGTEWDGLFAVTFDKASYTFVATATQKYLDLLKGRNDLPAAFSVYTQMIRIAPSAKVNNVVNESYNKVVRQSNLVWTSTPEHPSISIIKYTLSEGQTAGDRNDPTKPYMMTADELASPGSTATDGSAENGTLVGISFTNTGDVPLTNVVLVDTTLAGLAGKVYDITCAVSATSPLGIAGAEHADSKGNVWIPVSSIHDLAVSQTVDCKGILRDMVLGQTHGDNVVVTAQSIYEAKLCNPAGTPSGSGSGTPGSGSGDGSGSGTSGTPCCPASTMTGSGSGTSGTQCCPASAAMTTSPNGSGGNGTSTSCGNGIVTAHDPWFASAPPVPAVAKGAVTGDPIAAALISSSNNLLLLGGAGFLLLAAVLMGVILVRRNKQGLEIE